MDLEQTNDNVRVAAALDGKAEIITADYLIGADGARSAVRRSLGIEMSGDIYPETTILATTRFGLKAPTWQFRDRETGPVATEPSEPAERIERACAECWRCWIDLGDGLAYRKKRIAKGVASVLG